MKQAGYLLIVFLLLATVRTRAQVGIGTTTPAASSQLDITSANKGLLIPRMATAIRTGIASPATGLLVYDTDLNQFYFFNGTSWTAIANSSGYWTLSGNNLYNNAGSHLGIGTTSSGETGADLLGVKGNIRLIGNDTIFIAQSTTGSGKSLTLRAGYPYMPIGGSGGDLNLLATSNMPSGGSGWTNLGPSGNINLTAGSGYNSVGGNVNITAGQGSYWGLTSDAHSDVIVKGGYNINAADAGTITTEGGHILAGFNPSTSTGGNLILTPGTGANNGGNGSIKLDGIVAYGISMGLAGGPSGSPVSLLNQKSYIGLSPADVTNNYYQLPSPVTYQGRMYIIRNYSSSISVLITTAAGLLFPGNSGVGSVNYIITSNFSPKTVMAISDGVNWVVMKQD